MAKKKAILNQSPGDAMPPLPADVVAVEQRVKLHGEGLPEKFRTKEGDLIDVITLAELAELHPEPKEVDVSEKREDHPLWSEWVKFANGRGIYNCHHCVDASWDTFLAGAEAVKATEAPTPPFETALGCLTNAVERLKEQGNLQTLRGANLKVAVERLVDLDKQQNSLVSDQVRDQIRLVKILERLEELGKRQGVVHPSWTTNAYERMEASGKRLEVTEGAIRCAFRRLEDLTKRHERMGLRATVTENPGVTVGGVE